MFSPGDPGAAHGLHRGCRPGLSGPVARIQAGTRGTCASESGDTNPDTRWQDETVLILITGSGIPNTSKCLSLKRGFLSRTPVLGIVDGRAPSWLASFCPRLPPAGLGSLVLSLPVLCILPSRIPLCPHPPRWHFPQQGASSLLQPVLSCVPRPSAAQHRSCLNEVAFSLFSFYPCAPCAP